MLICNKNRGSSGIGEVISRELARKNAKVYITTRSQSRADQAIARIRAASAEVEGVENNLTFLEVDLETMKGATAAAKFFLKLEDRLDIVVANAGLGGIVSISIFVANLLCSRLTDFRNLN